MSDAGVSTEVESRAGTSKGTSGDAIYRLVARVLRNRGGGGLLLDVGCGAGGLRAFVQESVRQYHGIDAVRYEAFPADCAFHRADLDQTPLPLPDASADVVTAVETIEHLENPRAFMRELVRLAKPGGWVIVTTPNQLSWLSKLTLLLKNQFNMFQEAPGLYPTHITALLEIDLVRIARECKLEHVETHFTNFGRIPGTGLHWPRPLVGRGFSDNVLVVGQKK